MISLRIIKHYLNPCVSYVCFCDCRILARRAKTRNVGVWKLSSSQLQTANPCMWSAYFRSQLPFLAMDCQSRFIGQWHFYITFNINFLCAYIFLASLSTVKTAHRTCREDSAGSIGTCISAIRGPSRTCLSAPSAVERGKRYSQRSVQKYLR